MQPFVYHRAQDRADAIRSVRFDDAPKAQSTFETPAQFIAGGTIMLDYMKLGVLQPTKLVDINALSNDVHGRIEVTEGGLALGALVRMSQVEDHQGINRDYPVIAETMKLAASRQIRNMASLGGNILQRTRCEYFRETSWACNKRNPGSGCAALDGINREHVIFGGSPSCIATYHGDFAQALIALDATVECTGPSGKRTIPFSNFHRLPGDTPHVETVLEPGELVTFIYVPAGPHTRRSHYLKIRDRQSYQFAVTSAAVALDLDGNTVRDVRVALGGVATVPWRAREAEEALRGKVLDENSAVKAAEAAFASAKPLRYNAFKIPVGTETVVRALLEAKSMNI